MENKTKTQGWYDQITDKLNEQVWFQELKEKWEELDPQSKTNLKFGICGLSLVAIVLVILSSMWNVHSLKKELTEKQNLLSMIQNANDEVRKLRDTSPIGVGDDKGPWPLYFETLTASSGFDKSSLGVSNEKAGTNSDQSKELLYDLSVKHVNIRQIVNYAFALENGKRPIKVRNLSIDTKNELTGYLDATLSISAFTLVKNE